MKTFSASYENDPDLERLQLLKSSLDVWHGGRAPLLLRRLKEDKLPDLPRPLERVSEAVMLGAQLAQYEAAIDDARKIAVSMVPPDRQELIASKLVQMSST